MKYFKEKAGARPFSEENTGDGHTFVILEQEGMALIDWFAGQALVKIMENHVAPPRVKAINAYKIAKEMMEERARLMEEENG